MNKYFRIALEALGYDLMVVLMLAGLDQVLIGSYLVFPAFWAALLLYPIIFMSLIFS